MSKRLLGEGNHIPEEDNGKGRRRDNGMEEGVWSGGELGVGGMCWDITDIMGFILLCFYFLHQNVNRGRGMMEPAFHRGNVTGRPVITGTEQETSLVICIPDDKAFKKATGWNSR